MSGLARFLSIFIHIFLLRCSFFTTFFRNFSYAAGITFLKKHSHSSYQNVIAHPLSTMTSRTSKLRCHPSIAETTVFHFPCYFANEVILYKALHYSYRLSRHLPYRKCIIKLFLFCMLRVVKKINNRSINK